MGNYILVPPYDSGLENHLLFGELQGGSTLNPFWHFCQAKEENDRKC